MTTRSRMIGSRLGVSIFNLAAVSIMLAAGGCAAPGGGKSGSIDAAMTEYNAQQYGDAHDKAANAMSKSTGTQRERAAYVAGLSAYQSGDVAAAERDLGAASVSSDPHISGNAKAMLGQLRLDQRRPREAATYFADASRLLEGEDARQAAWHAGLAYRQAGDETSAKRWLNQASSARYDGQPSSPSTVAFNNPAPTANGSAARQSNSRATTQAKPVSTSSVAHAAATSTTPRAVPLSATGGATVGFTLQIGAFSDKARARTAAEDAEELAKNEGLGRVRIFLRRDARAQPMYLVHVGWWVTRAEASAARGKLGRLEYVVAPAPTD